ncbi:TRAP transporter small permease [Neorhizobium sp. NCHU2750]|uniref:TRAP transporter small permease n=1 Tax=Neorhizobium sp. NCHU2750 TaxID=1825976 RepID=UPI000E749F71|nr:dicarboxylate ABC transporter permease [Neorhizobium sp. NCHU2750]
MLSRIDGALIWLNKFVLGVLMLIMTVLVFANVVLRYVVGDSLSWVEEVTRYMMIWAAYLGAGLALRNGSHVAVELVQDALPTPAMHAVRFCVAVAILVFLGFVSWYGFAYSSVTMMQSSAVLNLPLGMVYLAVPVGCVLSMLHLLLGFRNYVTRRFDAAETAEAIGEAPAMVATEAR